MFLTVRQGNKRAARKTQANSKTIGNHQRTMSIHLFYYNACRKHESIGKLTPLHKLGITDKPWSLLDVVEMTERFLKKQAATKRRDGERAFEKAFAKWESPKAPLSTTPKKPVTPWYLEGWDGDSTD